MSLRLGGVARGESGPPAKEKRAFPWRVLGASSGGTVNVWTDFDANFVDGSLFVGDSFNLLNLLALADNKGRRDMVGGGSFSPDCIDRIEMIQLLRAIQTNLYE